MTICSYHGRGTVGTPNPSPFPCIKFNSVHESGRRMRLRLPKFIFFKGNEGDLAGAGSAIARKKGVANSYPFPFFKDKILS